MRRRALLAASVPMWEDEYLPPESTTYEFPLYLNTSIVEKASDFLYRTREADDISEQLREFYITNAIGNNQNVPNSVLKANPVYIDGALVTYAQDGYGSIALITDKDYGDYNEIGIYLDFSELWVEGFN